MQQEVPQSGWMSGSTLLYGLVGISAYTRAASEGDTYCPVCVRLLLKCGVPGQSKVGKMGLKVGCKQLLMHGVLQDLARRALWV